MEPTLLVKPPSPTASFHSEAHPDLADFTLGLIKAMLRTGYYAPDHPEARKTFTGLYEEFKHLIGARSELTYLVQTTRESRTIIIDGYDLVPLSLDQVMMRGMADLFKSKFLEFFDRWNLLSFSLKADITAEEFYSFIILMSQPPTASQGTPEAAERLTLAFLDQHILHISTVFNDDVVGKHRRLPWRVEMALSRLRRDLRLLPLYKLATPEKIQRVKMQVIDDVIRPVRTPGLLRDLLVNCDLVVHDIAVLEGAQIEREIVRSLSEEMLVATAWELVKDLEQPGTTQPKIPEERSSDEAARRLSVLREIAARLCSVGSTIEDDLLEALLREQVLPLEDLPSDNRRAVEARQLTETFLARKDQYLSRLAQIGQGNAETQLASMVHRIMPVLLRRKEYPTVTELLQAVNKARHLSPTSQVLEEMAGLLSQSVATQDTLAQLIKDLNSQNKDRRDHLVEILVFVGHRAGPRLLEAFVASDNKSVRVSTFEAIQRIGGGVLQTFLSQLPEIEHERLVICHILEALGNLGDASVAQPISRLLHHADVHVRQSALSALFKLEGAAAEARLIQALHDREGGVRQMAVSYLKRIRSRHPQAFEFYGKALGHDPSMPPETDAVLIQVCQALASFQTLPADDIAKAKTILLSALHPVQEKIVLAWFKGRSSRHSERVRAAIREALVALGTSVTN
ncbi:MAG: HEAT repeat domain-containing protein [Deltaproteobacteria bacterium]|nr:HEAT repeat domain-containing protein [Deltaproteobacteria bacterium]